MTLSISRVACGPGATVCVLTEPFVDLLAELVELDDRARAQVLVEIMGGAPQLMLYRRQLAPVDRGAVTLPLFRRRRPRRKPPSQVAG